MHHKIRILMIVFAVFSIAAGLAAYRLTDTHASVAEHWISVDSKELSTVIERRAADAGSSLKGLHVASTIDGIALLRLNEMQTEELSQAMHEYFNKCGGFVAHDSEADAIAWLTDMRAAAAKQSLITYTIDNHAAVNSMLSQTSEFQNRQTIIDLSGFPNRRYNQPSGLDSANWIKAKWEALAAGRSDASVAFFNHPANVSPQPSIIMTITGTELPNEIVVVGGHQDSINLSGQTLPAPGADDDASGIASMTEAIRVLMTKSFRPKRTVQFMAYAAEEAGLKGSKDIVAAYQAQNKNVVGVIQLDMTNYKGSPGYDIVLMTDYTNAAQNTFVTNLITAYQPTLTVGTSSCGYGCSDHASWYNKGYAASMPFEAMMNQDNPYIHTANDTIAQSGDNANHALKFAKLAISFVGELAKGSFATRGVPFDFDRDGKADRSVFRPSQGTWYVDRSQSGSFAMQFGIATDRIVPADYDGDGKADIAVYRPSQGAWYIYNSATSTVRIELFGTANDITVPGDYDGDGKADIAVYRPSTGTWWINRSTAGLLATAYGISTDIPAPADYDGDGKTDIAVYRPDTGYWYQNLSTGQQKITRLGSVGDQVVPADYDGDGKADIALFRPAEGNWYIIKSTTGATTVTNYGVNGDLPAPADFDGDGKADIAIFRPSTGTWWINRTSSNWLVVQYGSNGDQPAPGAFVR